MLGLQGPFQPPPESLGHSRNRTDLRELLSWYFVPSSGSCYLQYRVDPYYLWILYLQIHLVIRICL